MSTSTASSLGRIATAFLNELENEAKITRTCLERVPAEKFDWKPHEKSMTMGRLATHVAEMFGWAKSVAELAELDFSTIDYKPFEPKSTDELLGFLNQLLIEAKDAIGRMTDEQFRQDWTLRNGETIYFTMPRVAVMRTMVFNHIIHHRGQLSVYLRLNDIPVPSIYGPSADEGNM